MKKWGFNKSLLDAIGAISVVLSVQKIKQRITFYKALSKDKETPFVAKFVIIAAVAYLLSPIDLIPDFIPVLGHLDDLVIVPFLLWLALLLISKETKLRVKNEQKEFI